MGIWLRNRLYIILCLAIGLLIILAFDSKTKKIQNLFRWQLERENGENWHIGDDNPLTLIRRSCAELCDTTRKGTPGPYFDHVTTNIDCVALFENDFIDNSHGLPNAPKNIPKELMEEFTMKGRLPVTYEYFDQNYVDKQAQMRNWSRELIDEWVSMARKGNLRGNYGVFETNALRDGLKNAIGIKNGRVLVIGSEIPWVEACVLEAGAKEVVTLEYARIKSEHPQVKTLVPYEFRKSFLNNTLRQFDAIVTFSSIEHSGLGRYGDALNPWGDIIAIARAWCVAKHGASLTIGVPYNYEHEFLSFNGARVYGKIRYPYLTTNWKQIYKGKGYHRVFVLMK